MQYKIPVQIENEDPIILGLSLRQLLILMVGFGFAYLIFKTLAPNTGSQIALAPSGFIAILTVFIAVFKNHEMTFVPFVLALIRLNIFPRERSWGMGTDSFQAIDVGYLSHESEKKQEQVDIQKKQDSLRELQEKLKNI